MSRLTRDGRRPNLSRETKFSGANGDGEIFIFPVRPTTKHGWTRNSCADVVLRATGVLNYFVTNLITLLFRRFQLGSYSAQYLIIIIILD